MCIIFGIGWKRTIYPETNKYEAGDFTDFQLTKITQSDQAFKERDQWKKWPHFLDHPIQSTVTFTTMCV